MRTIKLLLVLAPFALAAACGGKKPEMAEPAVPTTPDMSLDSGALSNALDSGMGMADSAPSSDMMDAGSMTTPAVDAAPPPPVDAGKPGKDAGAKGPKGPKPKK